MKRIDIYDKKIEHLAWVALHCLAFLAGALTAAIAIVIIKAAVTL